jgi:hypothetical protein
MKRYTAGTICRGQPRVSDAGQGKKLRKSRGRKAKEAAVWELDWHSRAGAETRLVSCDDRQAATRLAPHLLIAALQHCSQVDQ